MNLERRNKWSTVKGEEEGTCRESLPRQEPEPEGAAAMP